MSLSKLTKNLSEKYRKCLSSKYFVLSFLLSLAMLAASFVMNFYATVYTNASVSSSVTDIVLSNTKVYDMDGLFVNGAILLVVFIAIVCLWEPKKIPFTIKTIALFVIVRSVFITLTHIGPFPTRAIIDPSTRQYVQDIIGKDLFFSFFTGNDFFFSGHTGLPFLMAMLYWDKIWLRWIFIAASLLFGTVVLLAHLHYTIDVLSAFFISYGIYHMAVHLFQRDFKYEKA